MNPVATVLVHPTNSDPTRYGVVKFRHLREDKGVLFGEVEIMVEKPSLEVAEAYKANGYNYVMVGYYAFKPKIFSYIKRTKPGAKNEVQITDAIALALENGERVCVVVHGKNRDNKVFPCDYWDVGIPDDYREANKRLLGAGLEGLISSPES